MVNTSRLGAQSGIFFCEKGMKPAGAFIVRSVALLGLLVAGLVPGFAAQADRSALPRTIITTDGEADDINSFIRLLYYSNELDIQGLVYTSSVHHWRGDGQHTLKQARDSGLITSFQGETAGSAARSDDAHSWRWEPMGWMESRITRDYAAVYPNLIQHDARYPTPAELWSKVVVGNVTWENDFIADTPGSDLIKAALLDGDRRLLYLQAWGGTNTIARALLSIENQFRNSPDWPRIRTSVKDKAVILAIGHQDNAWADYIGKSWSDIRLLDFDGVFGGFSSYTRSQAPEEVLPYYQARFWAPNIKYGHGPLLQGYGLVGDGTWFEGEGDNPGWQPGQAKDPAAFRMFNLIGGYERLDWTGEGDTPAFIALVPTGMRFLQDPSLGGWGGRLKKSPTAADQYAQAEDFNPKLQKPTAPYTTARWMADINNDFAARADWGISRNFRDANHAPRVAAVGPVDRVARAGTTVRLETLADDPDGNRLGTKWWIYTEASTLTGEAAVRGGGKGARSGASVSVPLTAKPGERIVVVASVVDDGSPALTRYAQFVITVAQ